MNALLPVALSSQITFNTTQQGDVYTIIPKSLLLNLARGADIVPARRQFRAKSETKQERTLSLPANQPIALTKMSLNISPDDRLK